MPKWCIACSIPCRRGVHRQLIRSSFETSPWLSQSARSPSLCLIAAPQRFFEHEYFVQVEGVIIEQRIKVINAVVVVAVLLRAYNLTPSGHPEQLATVIWARRQDLSIGRGVSLRGGI